jgi:hypothetical protein
MSNSSNAALVEQQLDPLARGQLALGMLGVDAALAAASPPPGIGRAPSRGGRLQIE